MNARLTRCSAFTALVALSCWWAAPVFGQQAGAERVGAQPSSVAGVGRATDEAAGRGEGACGGVACGGARRGGGLGLGDAELRRWAPVGSLLLPGLGQAVLRQDRFVAYLALEAWSVLEFANQRMEARRQQDRYRALARDVARSLYGPSYPIGPWAYYEAMEKYLESGVFDRVPGGDVDPEIDESTYNGDMWRIARETFWTDPAVAPPVSSDRYRYAVNFYLNRAIRPEFRWSWRGAQLEQDLYVRTIRRNNTAYRQARAALGTVIANHLLSAVDAFVTLRIEGLDVSGAPGMTLRGSLPIR